jgi:hypothetical protein
MKDAKQDTNAIEKIQTKKSKWNDQNITLVILKFSQSSIEAFPYVIM